MMSNAATTLLHAGIAKQFFLLMDEGNIFAQWKFI